MPGIHFVVVVVGSLTGSRCSAVYYSSAAGASSEKLRRRQTHLSKRCWAFPFQRGCVWIVFFGDDGVAVPLLLLRRRRLPKNGRQALSFSNDNAGGRDV
jgi:hypothetical protein